MVYVFLQSPIFLRLLHLDYNCDPEKMPKIRIPSALTPEFYKRQGLVPPAPPIDLVVIEKTIRQKRKALGQTLEETAKQMNISKGTLIKIENGKDVYVSTLNWVLSHFNIKTTLLIESSEIEQEWF